MGANEQGSPYSFISYLCEVAHRPQVERRDVGAPLQQRHYTVVGKLLAALERQRFQPPAVRADGLE